MFNVYRAAGLPCVVINGINKSAAYQLGRPIDRHSLSAQWNAVYVDGEWRLLDAFWASTCLIGRCSADWALIDVDGQMVDSTERVCSPLQKYLNNLHIVGSE